MVDPGRDLGAGDSRDRPHGGGEDFILYVPGEEPIDAQDISRTVVSREGEVLSVEIYEDVLRELGATKVD
ncbi:MAG: hypothetical protein GY745_22180 [Actinomycetia bacterium]|nr:hypothetical protein [Actinomycetes bacterium]